MSRTVAYAIDFILDTLDFSPDEPIVPQSEAILKSLPSADPMEKDLWAVVLWNDDKHSFDEVIHQICDNTSHTRDEAYAIVNRIDDQGREIIGIAEYSLQLLETAQTLGQTELGVTIRRAYDTFREQISAVIVEWLLDLTKSRLGHDTLILREVVASELLAPRRKDSSSILSFHDTSQVVDGVKDPARLDWMFIYHTRLWKKPRLNLKELYVSVLTLSSEHKLALGKYYLRCGLSFYG